MRFSGVVAFVSVSILLVGASCSSSGPEPGDAGDAAVKDVKPKPLDAADAGGCPSGLACEICDGGYSVTQMLAPDSAAGVCSSTDIAAFVAACGATATSTSCDTWQTAEGTSAPACYSCIYSNDSGPKWGVYVCDANGNCFFNSGGCFDVALGTVSQEKQASGAGSCGDLVNADFNCEDYSCGTCAGSDFDACLQSVDGHQCKTYSDAFNASSGPCAALDDASATVNSCYGTTDNDLSTMATIMCGTP